MDKAKNLVLPGAIIGAVFLALAATSLINVLRANAATTTGTDTAVSTTAATPVARTAVATQTAQSGQPPDPSQGGHVGTNGTKEELLTGDTAEKVKAAALAAVPGGTIQRVETDAEGAAYEAHMTKSDGTQVTLKLDSSFKVTGTENGMR